MTPLQEKLPADLREALRTKQTVRVSTLRLVLSAVRYVEIEKGAPLDDGEILSVFVKEVRKRRESIEAFQKGNRPDLVAQEEAELAVLQEYLPQQLSREELAAKARQAIAEMGAQGPRDKGRVIGKLVSELKGRAEGKDINEVVTQLLSPSPGQT